MKILLINMFLGENIDDFPAEVRPTMQGNICLSSLAGVASVTLTQFVGSACDQFILSM